MGARRVKAFLVSVVNFRSDTIADLGGKAIEGRNLEQAKSDLGTWCDCGMRRIIADGLGDSRGYVGVKAFGDQHRVIGPAFD